MLILNMLEMYFDAHDWNYVRIPEMPVLKLRVTGRNGTWDCYAQAHEDKEQFVFYSISPIPAIMPKKAAVAEFITRANYGMILGNFEMDYEDGEIRYKTSIAFAGAALSPRLIQHVVEANIAVMDAYLPGLERVVYADLDLVREIEYLEAETDIPSEDVFVDPNDDRDSAFLN